ncbi:unnamed protein product [Prorocentrum cordatum]|uniref:WW domain-containing protein n=1 Tax=Prorocentrum cordatum TaxID=2364126 RepID=A0ABN9RT28_9DINO|nr:unnamed protein product [Polarella glacialis]
MPGADDISLASIASSIEACEEQDAGEEEKMDVECADNVATEQVVTLEEKMDVEYEPNEGEIREYAEWLGMDVEEDQHLFWIARKGLKTALPKPWKPCESSDGDGFYFNPDTGESKWDHPCDHELRELYRTEKEKAKHPDAPATSSASLPRPDTAQPATEPAETPSSAASAATSKPPLLTPRSSGKPPLLTPLGGGGGAAGLPALSLLPPLSMQRSSSKNQLDQPLELPLPDNSPTGSQASSEAAALLHLLEGIPDWPDADAQQPPSAPTATPAAPVAAAAPTGAEAWEQQQAKPAATDVVPPPPALLAAPAAAPAAQPAARAPASPGSPEPGRGVQGGSPSPGGSDAAPSGPPAAVAQDGALGGAGPQGASPPAVEHDCDATTSVEATALSPLTPTAGAVAATRSPRPPLPEAFRQAAVACAEKPPDLEEDPLKLLELTSPETPQLVSVLAAELKQENSKDNLSQLWSQLDAGEPPADQKASSPRTASAAPATYSLELSSLSAIAEQSPSPRHCAGDSRRAVVEQPHAGHGSTASGRDRGHMEADASKPPLAGRLAALALAVGAGEDGEKRAAAARGEEAALEGTLKRGELDAQGLGASGTLPEGLGAGAETLRQRWGGSGGDGGADAARLVEQLQKQLGVLAARVQAVEGTRLDGPVAKPKVQLGELKVGGAPVAAEDVAEAAAACAERRLHESGLALQRERAEHCATRTALREAQRDVIRLQGELRHKEVEAEHAGVEARRAHAELEGREEERRRLQLQLHAKDSELAQLRAERATQARLGEEGAQQKRLELQQREQMLADWERFLQEKERLAAEAEVRLHSRARELRASEHQLELGGLRRALSEAGCAGPEAPRRARGAPATSGSWASPPPPSFAAACGGNTGRAGVCSAEQPTTARRRSRLTSDASGLGARRESSAPPGAAAGRGQGPAAASKRSNPGPVQAAGDAHGSASSTLSLRDELLELGSDEEAAACRPHDAACQTSAAAAALERLADAGPPAAAPESPAADPAITEALRARRRELRREAAELEDERHRWRSDVRRGRRSDGAAPHRGPAEGLAEARAALDARAASLNAAIAEYRSLERRLLGTHRRADAAAAAPPRAASRCSSAARVASAGLDLAAAGPCSGRSPRGAPRGSRGPGCAGGVQTLVRSGAQVSSFGGA